MEIIISNTNIGALLKATDKVLAQYGKDGNIPESLKGQATLSWLKQTFSKEWFDVCAVAEVARMNGVHISQEHNDYMHLLHCVHYKNMSTETREYLFAILVDYFRGNISMSYATGVSK